MKTIQNSIILLLFCSLSAFAQENDFQSWNTISLNKKVIKKTNASLKMGVRLRENASLKSKQFVDFKIKRKYNKRIAYALGYRYANNYNFQFNLATKHRFYTDINYKNKFSKRLSYSVRNRFQYQGNQFAYSPTLRQKCAVAYNIRKTKLTPSIATEYFISFDEGINKLRHTMALSYPLIKKLDFDLAYRIQQEFYVNNPQTLYIVEVKLAYTL